MQARLNQAKEHLDEAKDLLMHDAGVNFVMNNLYYAFLYALWGLLESQGISAPVHGEAISFFERDFVLTGKIEKRFHDALRGAFDLRPACDCEGKRKAMVKDVEQLLPIADEFLDTVARFVGHSC
jgi:uncharacterized protein (UPF0332 family)